MTPTPDEESVKESLIRLEAKIDVILGRHEARIEEITRRQTEMLSTQREHDARITANALTVSETRTAAANAAADVNALKAEIAKRGSNASSWVAVGVASLAVVIEPILNTLITKH